MGNLITLNKGGMTMPHDRKNLSIEEEISKQIDNLDHRFDRNGWFFLVLLIIIFFMLVYLFMQVFRVPETDTYTSSYEIQTQFESLEERVSSLENRLDTTENNQ